MESYSKKKIADTYDTLQHVEDGNRVYMMEYKNPYFLDEVLSGNGVSGTIPLLLKAMKYINGGKPVAFLPGRFACTAFNAKTPDGDNILGRNFDYKDAPTLIVWCNPENGYKSVGICDMTMMLYNFDTITPLDGGKKGRTIIAPYVTMDGMNEKGLAIAILEQKGPATNQKTSRPGITCSLAIRAVLDKCATVDEAIELLSSYDMHDSVFVNYHYQILDAEGNSAIVEYFNNKMEVIRPEKRKFYQYVTNFLVSHPGGDVKGNFGYSRYYQVRDCIEKKKGILTMDEAMDLLSHVILEYRHHLLKHRVTSLWSAVYNVNDLTIDLCCGADFSKKYSFSVNEPLKVEDRK